MANLSSCQRLPQKWVHCRLVRISCPYKILCSFPQTTLIKLEEFCQKNRLNSFYISQHSPETMMNSSYYEKDKWSEKAEEEDQVAYTKNKQPPVARLLLEKREQGCICAIPSFSPGFQQVPRGQRACHRWQQWHASVHARLGLCSASRSQW